MIGHMVFHYLKKTNKFLLFNLAGSRKINNKTTIIDVQDFEKIKIYIDEIKPDYIINCIGILINESKINLKKAIYLNALFLIY